MTKSSYSIIAVSLFFLIGIFWFTTPVYSQSLYPPTNTVLPDSCTGATNCNETVTTTATCCCNPPCTNIGKYVKTECESLTNPGTFLPCTQECQTSSMCGPTLAPTGYYAGCAACQKPYPQLSDPWTYVAQWDCGGSTCGCGERRTAAVYCHDTHCYDTCDVDTSCTVNCSSGPTNTPNPTPTNYVVPTDQPVYYGLLQAKVVVASEADLSCNEIAASTNYLSGALVTFSPYIGEPRLMTNSVISWNNVQTTGSTVYRISSTPPGEYALGNVCVSTNGGAYIQAAADTLPASGILNFVIAYLPQSGWVQTVGGDVYTATSLLSSIPSTVTTYFNIASAMGDAGIVSYGTTYDFTLDFATFGESLVSAKAWLIKQVNTAIDYYAHFTEQMDVPASATVIATPLNLTKPSTCTANPCTYYANGNMTTRAGSAWAIGGSEQTVIFVNGNVTINSNITVSSGGFLSIVANGNITIAPTVTVLQGIYIASNATHTAVFDSGSGTTQLVITGSVVADNFSLQRNLELLNSTEPGEKFIFNPQLLFTMPDAMKETPYIWQEVAP